MPLCHLVAVCCKVRSLRGVGSLGLHKPQQTKAMLLDEATVGGSIGAVNVVLKQITQGKADKIAF